MQALAGAGDVTHAGELSQTSALATHVVRVDRVRLSAACLSLTVTMPPSPCTWSVSMAGAHTGATMGLNPYRPHKQRRSDLVFVAAGLLVALLLVLWAFLG